MNGFGQNECCDEIEYDEICPCGDFEHEGTARSPLVLTQSTPQQATIDSLVHFIQGLIAGQALAADVLLESHSAYWVRAFKHLAEQRETKHV